MKQLITWIALTLFCQNCWGADESLAEVGIAATGEFKSRASILELLGETSAKGYEQILPVDQPIDWQVYVPPNYDPASAAGLLVYISPQDSGRIPRKWKTLMDESNLIWVAANHSGNKVNPARRIVYSLLAVSIIAREYRVDQSRIYVSGFSGGGRIASMVATQYPWLFKGAIYNCGVNFWEDISPKSVDLVKNNRFVFITVMVIPHMGHSNPTASNYAQAIAFLDNGLAN